MPLWRGLGGEVDARRDLRHPETVLFHPPSLAVAERRPVTLIPQCLASWVLLLGLILFGEVVWVVLPKRYYGFAFWNCCIVANIGPEFSDDLFEAIRHS